MGRKKNQPSFSIEAYKELTIAGSEESWKVTSLLSTTPGGGDENVFPGQLHAFVESEVTRLLSRFLDIFSQALRIPLPQLHSWICSDTPPHISPVKENTRQTCLTTAPIATSLR